MKLLLVRIVDWCIKHAGVTATVGTFTALGLIFLFFWCIAVFGPLFIVYLGAGIVLTIVSVVVFINIYFRLADLRQEQEYEREHNG